MPSEGFGGNGSEGTSGATTAARSGDGGNGNGRGANDGNVGEAQAQAQADQAARDAAAADAARQPVSETPPGVVGHEYDGPALNLNVGTGFGTEYTGPELDLNVGTGLLAAKPSPMGANAAPLGGPPSGGNQDSGLSAAPSGEDRGAFVPTSPLSIAQSSFNEAREALVNKISKETGLPSYAVQLTPKQEAGLLAQYSTTMADKWVQPARKGGEDIEHNDLKFDVSPAQLLGYTPDRETLKALSAMGLGGVYGVGGINPQQNADNIVAAQNVNTAINVAVNIAKNFIPGYGIVSFAANLLSGKITPGQAVVGIASDRVASLLGIPSSLFRSAISGDYGNGIAGWATSALNSYVAKETKTDPRLTALVFNSTGLPSLAKTSLSSLNVGPNFAGAAAGGIDSGLSSIGVGSGPATTTGNVPNFGTDAQSQAENILNPGSIAPTTAPLSLNTSAAPSTPLSSAGTSSGSYAGASPDMANSGSTSNVYRIGNTNYTPYKQDLAQLNLAPDEFTKQSDIGNIPVYNTDINKMANASFTQANDPYAPYAAAAGGSIRHFARAGAVYEDDPAGGTPEAAPTADQLEQRAALQSQAQYYKNLDSERQNADIMSSLRNLSGLGGAEAKPQSSPLIRLGQVGQYTPPKVLPQLAALLQARGMRLAEGGQPDDHRHPNYDGTPVFRTGGLSGLGGKYVEGKGDGTSDDITAMLADGEYVFSADVVSALGNGSNKAGAQVLDKTVEAIRSRARSTPPDKLPPDAKSPLEYMQSAKGKKHG